MQCLHSYFRHLCFFFILVTRGRHLCWCLPDSSMAVLQPTLQQGSHLFSFCKEGGSTHLGRWLCYVDIVVC
jgi:hypothetical protein